LRDDHKLVEARDSFRVCAQQACPAAVQRDCDTWLEEVERTLPTIVLSAVDAEGKSRTDVKVSVDGAPLAASLDGHSMPINPGAHTFVFEYPSRRRVEVQALVVQGKKDQVVAAAPPRDTLPVRPSGPVLPPPERAVSPWRTAGWISVAAGVAGVGAGVVLGLIATADKSDAHCNASGQCDPQPLSAARGAALGADIAFLAGGLLATGGLALVLFGPRGHGPTDSKPLAMRVVPTVASSGGGLALWGRW